MAATTPRKAPKKAAPRKARARAQSANGHKTPVTQAPTEFPTLELPKPPEVEHPYGDTPVYVYRPDDGSAPIVFPKIHTLAVSAKFMWKIYDLAEIFQSFEWMKLAGVPRDIQERVVDLPPVQRQRFWSGWFNDVTQPIDLKDEGMAPPGESLR